MGFSATFSYNLIGDYEAALTRIIQVQRLFNGVLGKSVGGSKMFNEELKRSAASLDKITRATHSNSAATEKAEVYTKRWRNSLLALGQGWDNMGTKMSKWSTRMANLRVGAAGYMAFWGLKSVVASSIEYSKSLNALESTLYGTTDSLEVYKKAIWDIAEIQPQFSVNEIAAQMVDLAKMGMSQKVVIGVMPSILTLAKAGDTEIAPAVEMARMAMLAFKTPVNEMGKVADILAVTAIRTSTDIEGLVTSFTNIAEAAPPASISIKEVAAALGAMSQHGIRPAMAGTYLKNLIKGMVAAGTDAKRIFANHGIYGGDILTPEGKIRDLFGAIDLFRKKGLGLGDLFRIFNVRGEPAAMALMRSKGLLEDMFKEYEKLQDPAKALAAINSKELAGGWKAMTVAFENFKVAIGNSIAPFTKLFAKVSIFFLNLTRDNPEIAKLIGGFLILTVVTLGLISSLGLMAATMGSLMLMSGGVTLSIAKMGAVSVITGTEGAAAFTAMAAGAWVATRPFLILLILLGGIVAAYSIIHKLWQFKDYVKGEAKNAVYSITHGTGKLQQKRLALQDSLGFARRVGEGRNNSMFSSMPDTRKDFFGTSPLSTAISDPNKVGGMGSIPKTIVDISGRIDVNDNTRGNFGVSTSSGGKIPLNAYKPYSFGGGQ